MRSVHRFGIIALLLALSCARGALGLDAAAETAPAGATPSVAYIRIDGEIDALQARYFARALADAQQAGAKTVVVHLNTDGGALFAAREMAAAALAVAKDHPRMVAFVDNRCYSGGAMVAYAHDDIYLSPRSTIGDIGVIMQGSDGKIEYGPEKIETVVRTLLRSEAKQKGWVEAKLVKMTARNQELYRFDVADRQEFVLEDDLPAWQHAHPEVDPQSRIVILGKDRLVSYTASEAVQNGMATALVDDLAQVYAKLGVPADQVLDLSPSRTELTARWLSGWSFILAAITAFCIFLEFKAPGIGIWTACAVIFGTAFFICQYYQDLANYPEVILVVLGVGCIAVELFLFPTAGWLAIVGIVLGLSGLVLSFMPDPEQFHPSSDGWGTAFTGALEQSLLSLLVISVGAVIVISTLPKSRALRRIAATAEIDGTSAGASEGDASLIGRTVVTRTALSPSGSVTIDGRDLSATSEHGEYVLAGAEVLVVGLRYGGAVVRPMVRPIAAPTPAGTVAS
ncbi:MAG: hypothetical protein H0W83_17000 [Planctomycetes bacterium]|nr:hypothetical protein [Planctomycetota bacterium]